MDTVESRYEDLLTEPIEPAARVGLSFKQSELVRPRERDLNVSPSGLLPKRSIDNNIERRDSYHLGLQ